MNSLIHTLETWLIPISLRPLFMKHYSLIIAHVIEIMQTISNSEDRKAKITIAKNVVASLLEVSEADAYLIIVIAVNRYLKKDDDLWEVSI